MDPLTYEKMTKSQMIKSKLDENNYLISSQILKFYTIIEFCNSYDSNINSILIQRTKILH